MFHHLDGWKENFEWRLQPDKDKLPNQVHDASVDADDDDRLRHDFACVHDKSLHGVGSRREAKVGHDFQFRLDVL